MRLRILRICKGRVIAFHLSICKHNSSSSSSFTNPENVKRTLNERSPLCNRFRLKAFTLSASNEVCGVESYRNDMWRTLEDCGAFESRAEFGGNGDWLRSSRR